MVEFSNLQRIIQQAEQKARQAGALHSIATIETRVNDGLVEFVVRLIDPARRGEWKPAWDQNAAAGQSERPDPFLPYDPALFVADLSESHLCLLNKFNVVDGHILLVTRGFESQENLITLRDFQAWWSCLQELDWLGFYNGGQIAGASQPHKHLQLVAPLAVGQNLRAPIESALAKIRFDGAGGVAPALPFFHRVVKFPRAAVQYGPVMAELSLKLYRAMLEAVGLNGSGEPEASRQAGPYNLLMTRDWMLLAPRAEERFKSISINSLGFAGTFLVRDSEQRRTLIEAGPLAALRRVTAKRN